VNTPANVKINIQSGNTLRIFGNLTIQGRFARLGNGVVSFESSVLNRVVFTPRCPLGRVEFNSGFGSWLIQDTLQATQVGIRAGKVYLGRSYFRATNVSGTGGQFHLDSGLIRIYDSYVLNGNVFATSEHSVFGKQRVLECYGKLFCQEGGIGTGSEHSGRVAGRHVEHAAGRALVYRKWE
jgi:hypothetical protein